MGRGGPDLAEWPLTLVSPGSRCRMPCERAYRVFMVGFLPGFPYMGTVDERIAMMRRATPRLRIAGSVGIAGRQTGIYPVESPGVDGGSSAGVHFACSTQVVCQRHYFSPGIRCDSCPPSRPVQNQPMARRLGRLEGQRPHGVDAPRVW
jgi:hypothetical protein